MKAIAVLLFHALGKECRVRRCSKSSDTARNPTGIEIKPVAASQSGRFSSEQVIVRHISQSSRYAAAQLVAAKEQMHKILKAAQFARYLSSQLIPGQIQLHQVG